MSAVVSSAQPQLLISVRSAAECVAAMQPGVDYIDVKDPDRGSLGQAQFTTIEAVLRHVNGRVSVSAALGELRDVELAELSKLPSGLQYVKFGLSHLGDRQDWPQRLALTQRALPPRVSLVAVAYADARLAGAPDWRDVLHVATRLGIGVMLVDTYDKAAGRLLDWLGPPQLQTLVDETHRRGMRLALAGSLTSGDVSILCPLRPDILAVRSAATEGGRSQPISAVAVQRLVAEIPVDSSKQVS